MGMLRAAGSIIAFMAAACGDPFFGQDAVRIRRLMLAEPGDRARPAPLIVVGAAASELVACSAARKTGA